MDNIKNDSYYVNKILIDVKYLIELSQKNTKEQIILNETILDSIFFRFIQIAENASKLSQEYKQTNNEIKSSKIEVRLTLLL